MWVTTPDEKRARKYIYGDTEDEVRAEWLRLFRKATTEPMPTACLPHSGLCANLMPWGHCSVAE